MLDIHELLAYAKRLSGHVANACRSVICHQVVSIRHHLLVTMVFCIIATTAVAVAIFLHGEAMLWREVSHHAVVGQADLKMLATRETLLAIARQGKPVVLAIYRFKHDRGLWPCELEELAAYLPAKELNRWKLLWWPDGNWRLLSAEWVPNWSVKYEHSIDTIGWHITDGVESSKLDIALTIPTFPAVDTTTLSKQRLHTIKKRIAAYPKKFLHRQGLIVHLYRANKHEEARRECLLAKQACPKHWWPALMAARIDKCLGKDNIADGVKAWAASSRDCSHHVLAAETLWKLSLVKDAEIALSKASSLPLADLAALPEATESVGWCATHFAWSGSLMAYNAGWYDIVHRLCDRWEAYDKASSFTHDPGYTVLRAACFLRQGEMGLAAKEITRARKLLRDRNYGWNTNLYLLEEAIVRKDKEFRYTPDEKMQPVPIFIDYN